MILIRQINIFKVFLPLCYSSRSSLLLISHTYNEPHDIPAYSTGTHCFFLNVFTGCTSVDLGASASLELIDKFSYLGVMLSVGRDADEARIRIVWNKFMQLVPLLTNKDIIYH